MYNRELGKELLRLKRYFPVVVVTGPRQSGKTTLCKMVFPDYGYVNLEDEFVRNEFALHRRAFLMTKGNLIIDEAQNLTPLEVKTVITRAGEGTKMVFTGDIFQIDQPYLDRWSNGLSHLGDRLGGQELFQHVFLRKGERSALSDMASRLL